MVTAGGKAPRLHGEMLVATNPNAFLRFDFLSMLEGEDGSKFLFVLKDGRQGSAQRVQAAGHVLAAPVACCPIRTQHHALGSAERGDAIDSSVYGVTWGIAASKHTSAGTPLEASVTWVEAEIKHHLQTVLVALDSMHAEMTNTSDKRRRAACDRPTKKRGVTLPKFSEGDFVLAATATGRSGNKLGLVSYLPKCIVGVINGYMFEVQNLLAPFATSLRHASRLQFYRDANRGLEQSLVEKDIHRRRRLPGQGQPFYPAEPRHPSLGDIGQVVRPGRGESLMGSRRRHSRGRRFRRVYRR
ncbi:hypothetical protein ON010_g18478 [Phytophthora cinnamomi]|nr:hypothetical protein ON010_g18478 [Phytophthora cinnamomi]